MTTETDIDETVPEDVTGLKRKVRELLRQVRKLKGKPVDNDDPAETPREKFVRENAARLKAFEPGSAEWQAEHDKILTEMEPLIAAEAAAHGGEALSARMSAAIVKGRREQAARAIVTEIARPGAYDVLLPHVLERVRAEAKDDDAVVTILSATGKPTSRNGLIEELRQTPAFAPLVQGASQSEQAAHARKVAETLGVKH